MVLELTLGLVGLVVVEQAFFNKQMVVLELLTQAVAGAVLVETE
jgi:hypothetical protein